MQVAEVANLLIVAFRGERGSYNYGPRSVLMPLDCSFPG